MSKRHRVAKVRRTLSRKKPPAAGPKGPRGAPGATGARGAAGTNASPATIAALRDEIAALRADLAIQLRRIGELQAQVDGALAELAAKRGKRTLM